jgi:hypothetical protein
VTASASPPFKRMKLRYAGTCRGCGAALPAGHSAVYYSDAKQVECLDCFERATAGANASDSGPGDARRVEELGTATATATATETVQDGPPASESDHDAEQAETGTGGVSARREHARRVAKREKRIRSAHPRLGGLILAVTDDPQSTRAWARGAVGEEKLARHLDTLTERGARVLHDRRIPRSRANIDHLVVAPAGVFVIDAKRYVGRPHLQVRGGLVRLRTETLMVGRRDCSKLVDGVQKQVELVRAELAQSDPDALVPVRGMLCFVDADWPLIGGSFATGDIDVLWPKKVADRVLASEVLTADQIVAAHGLLASAFPSA